MLPSPLSQLIERSLYGSNQVVGQGGVLPEEASASSVMKYYSLVVSS
jgi:hypothetical protein